MSIYKRAVERPITTAMVFTGIIVMGIYSIIYIPIALFPDMEPPSVTVMTVYSGAGASDIEKNVTRPMEDALNTVENLKEISSVSSDNLSVINLEFEWGINLDEATNEIRDVLDLVRNGLPEDVERPTIFKFNTSMIPILFYAVTADESYAGLDRILEDQIINPLNRIEGIGSVSLIGTPERRIYVEVDPVRLAAWNLTIEQIGNAIRAENMNLPAGNLKMGMMDYQLRVEGEFAESRELGELVVSQFGGKSVLLRDVAQVRDSLKDMSIIERINGRKGMRMFVMKQSGANTVRIAQDVKDAISELKADLPPDVEIREILDTSVFINQSVNNLSQTMLWAILFVIIVVRFFLGKWRATFIVMIAIPISLIVAFIYLFLIGGTLNVISLSAMAIALGMVVDDAIVVLENISRHVERGTSAREASIYATNEVWLAVIVTTMVIVAVFFPLTLLGGMTGVLFTQLGWIVTITVVTSTTVAITLTPMMSSKLFTARREKTRRLSGINNFIETLHTRMADAYETSMRNALLNRKKVLAASLLVFVASLLLLNFVSTEFMPEADESQIRITAELTTGLRVEEADKVARRMESIVRERYPEIEIMAISSGSDDAGGMLSMFMQTGSNIVNQMMRLVPVTERERSVWDIMSDMRAQLDGIPEIVSYSVSSGGGEGMSRNTVDVEIYGYDFDVTSRFAADMEARIASIDGAEDVQVSRKEDRPELQITLDRKKLAENGLNTAMVSNAVRNRVAGLTTSVLREEGYEYDIVVRYDERFRNSISDLEDIALVNAAGRLVPLSEIGTVDEYWNPPSIERKRRERVVTVSAVPAGISLGDLAGSIRSIIDETDLPAGVTVNVGGAYEDMADSFTDLGLLLLLSLILVFLVMASQFESFVMPFVIMFSIPFAFTGVILALFLTGTTLSVIAGLGAVLLIGIVVKNGIVLIDYINLMRDRGQTLDEAIIAACRSRLRPVLMTAMTTILAMLPLALSGGEGAETWRPMGVALVGGLLFSTAVTLILIPVVYALFSRRGERDKLQKLREKFTFLDEQQECGEAS
ncbi:MAG: efflux RND transporter permease subunit [Bacteroidetes bacterium]|nr:efflux RND transporter permease subunit [Bacteroidota bacterium]